MYCWILPSALLLGCGPEQKPGGTGGPATGEDSVPDGESGETETPDSDAMDSDSADTQDSSDTQDSASGCRSAEDCDDHDACTVDACEDGACASAPWTPSLENIFDIELFDDESTLNLEVLSEETVWEDLAPVTVQEIRFTSYEVTDCAMTEIPLQGFLVFPADASASSTVPGVVLAHGLGGMGDPDAASGLAGALGVAALAYSGPGQGESEGRPCDVNNLFRTTPDPRESWFWAHDVAAMRALTALTAQVQVDADSLGIAGYSAGALAALTAAAVDPRVVAAVPVSGTGFLDEAAAAGGWENDLLASTEPPLDTGSAAWASYEAWLDPKNYLGFTAGDVLLLNGAQDEFFPITSTVSTFDALAASPGQHRITHIKDWDHGWFAAYGSADAEETTEGTLHFFLKSRLGLDAGLAELPPQPVVDSVTAWTCYDPDYPWITWSCALVVARLPGGTDYDVGDVQFHWSLDGLTYSSWNLGELGDGETWYAEVGTLDGSMYGASNLVWFAEFDMSDGIFGTPFTLTSAASVPDGFMPKILTITGEIPI